MQPRDATVQLIKVLGMWTIRRRARTIVYSRTAVPRGTDVHGDRVQAQIYSEYGRGTRSEYESDCALACTCGRAAVPLEVRRETRRRRCFSF